MEQKTLAYADRSVLNKGSVRKLRSEGQIPGIIYGQGNNVPISINSREFGKKFKTISETTLIKLENGKKSYEVLIKDFQEDILTSTIEHIDFFEVSSTKVIKTHLPVHLKGTAIGVKNGGLVEHNLHEIEIECLPKDLPQELSVDISKLDVGMSIHLSEITALPGVKIHTSGDTVIAHVINTRNLNVEPVAEVAAAPEAAAAAPADKEKKA